MDLIACNMENIPAAVFFDNVTYGLGIGFRLIAGNADVIILKASYVDHGDIVICEDLLKMLFDDFAEIGAYLYNTVEIIKIRDIKGNTVAFIVFRELAIVFAAVGIAEAGKEDKLNAISFRSIKKSLLHQSGHLFIYMRCKNRNFLHKKQQNFVWTTGYIFYYRNCILT